MMVEQYLSQILTALVLIILGGWLYEARDGFFLSGGSFRGKIISLAILVGSVAFVVFVTPSIVEFWNGIRRSIGLKRIVGFILLLGMIAVNNISDWNYLDTKSVLVYVIGLVIIFQSRALRLIDSLLGNL
ncbi:hypothetical protein DJ68_16345 [Halorubrum sp. C3]|nr:hypothetical protein DJ68_16345 [Halorubrum sp. C3]